MGEEDPVTHMSIEAGHGQGVLLACDPKCTEPAWKQDPPGMPEGVGGVWF
jgi:hypothetical protein